ncbi:hypothetical protein F5884DRAFT_161088 [Xylogone sp. PMI_703]|nr:hypothetical protein F5884DRAFT_161088 [Xylogone sp. PMI_703]
MSLTVKHLNSDASFLLSFAPIITYPLSPDESIKPFTVVLDPWLSGPSKIWHSKFSMSTHKTPSCISSLGDLPEPDVVVVSQHKEDHCHKSTLKQLQPTGGKTIIAGPPAAIDVIRRWKYFDRSKLIPLRPWQSPSSPVEYEAATSNLQRIPIPAIIPNGLPGELTLAFLPQKNDITGLHSAIGITYQPPSTSSYFPATDDRNQLPTPPHSPSSFNSTFTPNAHERPLSIIYSPHGCTYTTIAPYATSHLVSRSALPLTLLLHCFDRVSNPWYLGGNICTGLPGGQEIAKMLGAKCWVGAHDGDKEIKGVASKKLKVTKWGVDQVQEIVSPRSERFEDRALATEVVALGVGEEITLARMVDIGSGSWRSPVHSCFASDSLGSPSIPESGLGLRSLA